MKYTFWKIEGGSEGKWGWWLMVKPNEAELVIDLHKQISLSMFARYQKNPHFKGAMLDKGPIELASRWLQTIEKMLARQMTVFVNENGGMFGVDKIRGLVVLGALQSDKLAFPPRYESIANRKIDVQRWYGGTHFYLQCQDKMVFSKDKFDTLAEAQTEAELYALPQNIRLTDATFYYQHEGD